MATTLRPSPPQPSLHFPTHSSHYLTTQISPNILNLSIFPPFPSLSLNLRPFPSRKSRICSTVEAAVPELEEGGGKTEEETEEANQKRKLVVFNFPWSYSVVDIKNLFGECGTVVDVEIIKQKNGKSRGYAFVTMSSGEEAQAVIEKFDSCELLGRIVRVEYAKRFKKLPPPPPKDLPPVETRHRLFVSNLAWKVRSTHLRECFAEFNPVSARVVFDSPKGRSAGYGFVSFATKEEAEAVRSAMDGKELFERPITVKFSEKSVNASQNEDGSTSEEQSIEL